MTVRETLGRASEDLSAAGIPSARLDAEVLLAGALGMERPALLAAGDRPVDGTSLARFQDFVERRRAREPVSHILGVREFWSLDFTVTPAVLDPRPDSETLIEAVLAYCPAGRRILDLGTGAGCLLIALLSELPAAQGVGVDISAAALTVARDNAARNGVAERAAFYEGGWESGPATPFDIIVANPPYIPSGEMPGLAPEVQRFEPALALDGGADGLDAYRAVLPVIGARLDEGGTAFVEIGAGQSPAVVALAEGAGLRVKEVRKDLGRIERCIILQHR